jgi:hypothetical protein
MESPTKEVMAWRWVPSILADRKSKKNGVLAEPGDRSIEELELERDSMLIELLATRAKGEKAEQTAAAAAGTAARTK